MVWSPTQSVRLLKNPDFLDASLWIVPLLCKNKERNCSSALAQTQILDLPTYLVAKDCQHWHPCVGARHRGLLQFAVPAEEDSVSDSQVEAKALWGAVWNFRWHGETRAADSWEILLRRKSSRLEILSTAQLSHKFSLVDRPVGFESRLLKALNLSQKLPFWSTEDGLVIKAVGWHDALPRHFPWLADLLHLLGCLFILLHQRSVWDNMTESGQTKKQNSQIRFDSFASSVIFDKPDLYLSRFLTNESFFKNITSLQTGFSLRWHLSCFFYLQVT